MALSAARPVPLDIIRARLLWRSPTESVLSSVVVAWNPLDSRKKTMSPTLNYPFEREPQTGDGSAVEIAPGVCGYGCLYLLRFRGSMYGPSPRMVVGRSW